MKLHLLLINMEYQVCCTNCFQHYVTFVFHLFLKLSGVLSWSMAQESNLFHPVHLLQHQANDGSVLQFTWLDIVSRTYDALGFEDGVTGEWQQQLARDIAFKLVSDTDKCR